MSRQSTSTAIGAGLTRGLGISAVMGYNSNLSISFFANATDLPLDNLTTSPILDEGNASGNASDGDGGGGSVHPLWLTIFLALLVAVISIVTILGNLTVLLSFWIERSIRQPTNYFLASLAVSDLLIGTFSMPLFTQYLLLGRWPLGPWLCDVWLSLDWTVCLTSQYTVFLITMDRFLSVKIPAKYRNWRTERKVYVMIAVTWVLPTLVFFTSIIGWQFFMGERTVPEGYCEVQFMSEPLFTFILTIGYYWITLVVMCGLYAGIYKVALNLQRKSDAKQKKLRSAIELAADHSTMRNTGSNSSDSITQAPKKAKPVQSNLNGGQKAAAKGVSTTSFSKQKTSEKEEERSSSPAFASDEEEDNSSSQDHGATSKTPLTNEKSHKSKSKHQAGFVNNALQADSTKSARRNVTLEKAIAQGPLVANLLRPVPIVIRSEIKDDVCSDCDHASSQADVESTFSSVSEKTERSSAPLLPNEALKGSKYIDEKSFMTFNADNAKLISEPAMVDVEVQEQESKTSPVWKRRSPGVDIDCEDSLDFAYADDVNSIAPTEEEPPVVHIEPPQPEPGDNHVAPDPSHLEPPDNKHMQTLRPDRRRRKDNKLHSFVKSVRLRNSRRRNRRERKSKSENRARKALRTITLILGAFVLCWTPYHIMVFVIAICGGHECINMEFYSFTYFLCYLNSPINPFCYAFANAQFKRTFLRILRFDWHRT